jgi:hypothetical protein
LIYRFVLDGVPDKLGALTLAITMLEQVDALEAALDPATHPQAVIEAAAIRAALRDGDPDAAKLHLDALRALVPAGGAGAVNPRAEMIVERLQACGAVLDHLISLGDAGGRAPGLRGLFSSAGHFGRSALFGLSGLAEQATAEARLWFVRPLLAILLYVLLVGVGLKTLYLTDASFGHNGFLDYFGLVLWGLSADVAARTLSSLGGTPVQTAPAAGVAH